MFERYTEHARRALFFARYECLQAGQLAIEPEHLLLGLVREDSVPVGRILRHAATSPGAVRAALDDARRASERTSASLEIPFSDGTKRILQLAAEEADEMEHAHIGSEHLFLAILRNGDDVASAVLQRLGVRLQEGRQVVREFPPPPPDLAARAMGVVFTLRSIGVVRSPFTDTADVPKGLGARHTAEGTIDVRPEFEAGLQDIEGFSHLHVIWLFDRVTSLELIAHPPSDDRPHGVFATRSPQRPNPIGLTVVELLGREGPRLRVRGIDMLDGSPVLDIKPYLTTVAPDGLRRGWLAEAEARKKQK